MRLLASLVLVLATSTSMTLLSTPVRAADPAPARQGVWPLVPRPEVVSGFDPPSQAWGSGHRGVDLLGRAGLAVRTSLGGTVTFAARFAGRGVVVVDHDGVRTTYEPVSAGVVVGQQVGRGARIGILQRASSHCFPRACLHWGLLQGDTYLDPLTLGGAGPIRLLPLDGEASGGPALGSAVFAMGRRASSQATPAPPRNAGRAPGGIRVRVV
jgi:murein DD-endopeptidase MepM/ murein hydrolase activator NlpD